MHDEAFSQILGEREASILRPAATQIASIVKEYGFARIYVFPSLDAAIASAILVHVLRRFSVRHALAFRLLPPREPAAPSILLGYPTSVAYEVAPKKASVLIGVGEAPQGILPLVVAAVPGSSVSGVTAAVLSELTVVGRISAYSVAAGIWERLDRGKRGELTGIETSIVEVLSLENIVETRFNIRLARWRWLPTEKALPLTWLPFLPGLTEQPTKALEWLSSDPRLKSLVGQTMDEAPEESVATLGEKLYTLLREASRLPRRPTEVVGLNYYYPSGPLPDLREAAAALACGASSLGGAAIVGLGVNERLSAAAAYARFRFAAEKAARELASLLAGETKPRRLRLGKVEVVLLSDSACPLLVEHEAYRLGHVQPESVAGFETPEGILVSPGSLIRVGGLESVSGLVEQGCLRRRGDSIMAVVGGEECG